MVENHDIDALLISALYGELTPADEARLATHLESHPTDRSALDDLTRARSLVRDSRFLAFQLDPPQAVSALLLQEAARRAPAPRRAVASESASGEGWFFRFVKSFAGNPAMAAAAMLVLVVGVAGVMKMNANGDFKSAPIETRSQAMAAAPAPAQADPAQGTATLGAAMGSAAPVIAGNNGYVVNLDEGKDRGGEDQKVVTAALAQPTPAKPAMHAGAMEKKGMSVTTPEIALKEEDDNDGAVDHRRAASKDAPPKKADDDSSYYRNSSGGAAGGPGAAAMPTVAATQPPSPAPEPMPVAKAPARDRGFEKPSAPPADAIAQQDPNQAAPDTTLAWAKAQHAQVVALAKNTKDCDAAAKLANTILARAPDYYAQNVATDRDLKNCTAYIASQRDAAEKAAAMKRASKRSADEPAAAPPAATKK
jgi:hypothetical protein